MPLRFSGIVFVIIASGVVAVRLIITDSVVCACFGRGELGEDNSMLEPARSAWYGFRNGSILLGLLGVYANSFSRMPSTVGLLLVAMPSAAIASGLIGSIIRNRQLLTLLEHPREAVLAPRLAPLVAMSWYASATRPPSVA